MSATRNYQGFTIEFDESTFTFLVSFPDSQVRYASRQEAETNIEKYLAQERATKKKQFPAIAAFASTGQSTQITGIHARNYVLLLKPEPRNKIHGSSPTLYADAPQVRVLVQRLIALEAESNTILKQLEPTELALPSGSYRQEYEAVVDSFLSLAKKAQEAAAHLSQEVADAETQPSGN